MMSLTFGLFTQVSGSMPLGPLVFLFVFCCLFLYSREATVQLQIKPIQVYLIIWMLQLFHEKQFTLFFIDIFCYFGRNLKLQMINFHYLDELLSISIDVAFSFKIMSDTLDCFHTEA